jgi:hypothetical protein
MIKFTEKEITVWLDDIKEDFQVAYILADYIESYPDYKSEEKDPRPRLLRKMTARYLEVSINGNIVRTPNLIKLYHNQKYSYKFIHNILSPINILKESVILNKEQFENLIPTKEAELSPDEINIIYQDHDPYAYPYYTTRISVNRQLLITNSYDITRYFVQRNLLSRNIMSEAKIIIRDKGYVIY